MLSRNLVAKKSKISKEPEIILFLFLKNNSSAKIEEIKKLRIIGPSNLFNAKCRSPYFSLAC